MDFSSILMSSNQIEKLTVFEIFCQSEQNYFHKTSQLINFIDIFQDNEHIHMATK